MGGTELPTAIDRTPVPEESAAPVTRAPRRSPGAAPRDPHLPYSAFAPR